MSTSSRKPRSRKESRLTTIRRSAPRDFRSRYSGKSFVRAYPRERQEMFLDGHIRAFDWYGGVFPTVVFDNLKTAVRRILRWKARIEQARSAGHSQP